jgi:hypothetical protein
MRPAIIVDLDGTLAHHDDRDIFDSSRVDEDTLDPAVYLLVTNYSMGVQEPGTGEHIAYMILIVTGRWETCREETAQWLNHWSIQYEQLYMRRDGDYRPDYVIKREIYETAIKGNYRVDLVLEDRDQCVKMWREQGLTCFQVAEGNFH